MKSGCVWTASDDIRIAPVVSISEFERVCHHSINLVFPFRICCCCPCTLVSFSTDINCMLHEPKFHGRLAEPHGSKDRPCVLHAVAGGSFRKIGNKSLLLFILSTFEFPWDQHVNISLPFGRCVE